MTDDLVADLKQFISAAVSQQTSDVTAGLRDLQQQVSNLATELSDFRVDTGQSFHAVRNDIADLDVKLSTVADAHAADLGDREQRLTRLERRSAA